ALSAPSTATAGTAFNFTVTALDQFNNTATGYTGSVHFTSSSAGTMPANSTLSSRVRDFPATLTTSGNQTITGTDTVSSSITGTSNVIGVNPATPSQLLFTVQPPQLPATVTASDATAPNFNASVTIEDSFGNVVPTNGDMIEVTVHSP